MQTFFNITIDLKSDDIGLLILSRPTKFSNITSKYSKNGHMFCKKIWPFS